MGKITLYFVRMYRANKAFDLCERLRRAGYEAYVKMGEQETAEFSREGYTTHLTWDRVAAFA